MYFLVFLWIFTFDCFIIENGIKHHPFILKRRFTSTVVASVRSSRSAFVEYILALVAFQLKLSFVHKMLKEWRSGIQERKEFKTGLVYYSEVFETCGQNIERGKQMVRYKFPNRTGASVLCYTSHTIALRVCY